jgi:hypothetical protein
VRAGEAYSSEIVTAIENAHILLLVLTKNVNKTVFVTSEVDRAYNKQKTINPSLFKVWLGNQKFFVDATGKYIN